MKSTTHNYIYFIINFIILEYHICLRVSNGLARVGSQPKFSEMPSKTPQSISFAFRILKILFNHYVSVRLGVLKSDHERV